MYCLDTEKIMQLYGAILPVAILLVESGDEERDFLAEMYVTYRGLMYSTVRRQLGYDVSEIEDAISASVFRMCKYCKKFMEVECNKRAQYVVSIAMNVCRSHRKDMAQSNAFYDRFATEEEIEGVTRDDVQNVVFDRIYAVDLLNSFHGLSERDKDILLMRHVDMMDFADIAASLQIQEGTVRTALTRAKKRLETQAERKGENPDE